MLYRKKILLSLIEIFGGQINATSFQKLLFLFSQKQDEASYDFIPYKYGCFSFQSMADKNNLIKTGYLKDVTVWNIENKNSSFISELKENDKKTLQRIKLRYTKYTTTGLLQEVYRNYPYFAINSEVAKEVLNEKEQVIVKKMRPVNNKTALYTIGYEGKSIESYLNQLIKHDVKVLFDVRKNALSRKYGFSKNSLQKSCEAVNIKYIHTPELGIISSKRKQLITQQDYDNLFYEYEQTVLKKEKNTIRNI